MKSTLFLFPHKFNAHYASSEDVNTRGPLKVTGTKHNRKLQKHQTVDLLTSGFFQHLHTVCVFTLVGEVERSQAGAVLSGQVCVVSQQHHHVTDEPVFCADVQGRLKEK